MFNFFGRRKTANDFVAEAKEKYGLPDPSDYGINREDAQPEPKRTPKMPEVNPPKEKDATVFYRLGVTDNNRVAFQMGYNEITMNRQGCQNLIDQLTFFMNQLENDHVEETSDSDDSSTT